MWWLCVNFLPTNQDHPIQTLPTLPPPHSPDPLSLSPSAALPTEPPPPASPDPAPPHLRHLSHLSHLSRIGRRRTICSQIQRSQGRMDGTVQTPSGTVPRVAAHPSVNGNGAARHLHDEWLEEYEAGVFMKLKDLGDGTRELMRVRFSKTRFGEHQAENWWKENREKVYERYNVRTSQRASSAASTHSA
ncbi:hypothetical protein VPH35_005818 [Triticum aestivum]